MVLGESSIRNSEFSDGRRPRKTHNKRLNIFHGPHPFHLSVPIINPTGYGVNSTNKSVNTSRVNGHHGFAGDSWAEPTCVRFSQMVQHKLPSHALDIESVVTFV